MLVAIGPIGFCLALMAFMPSLWTTALLVFAFFFAYYVYEPPYRGLYPDLLPERVYGRAQGVQHLFRGIALGGGLIGGGVLYHLWQPAPFLFAAGDRLGRLPRAGPVPARGRRPRARLRGGRDLRPALVARAARATRTSGASCSRTRPGRGRSPAPAPSSSSTSRSASASRSRPRPSSSPPSRPATSWRRSSRARSATASVSPG